MGTRRKRERQEELWVAREAIVRPSGHAFYDGLNRLLAERGFDRKVEHLCQRYYKGVKGRPSMPPGVYFRALLVGYFEGLDSERGIAWRVADSLSLRKFLGYGLDETTPDHSTISRTRRLYSVATHRAVFGWVLRQVDEAGLLSKTVGIDSTPLEANAAMRTIVRRDTEQGYAEYVKGLAVAAGMEEPTAEEVARFDRKRKKKTSNRDWKHPDDPDARITKMKDGRTRMAHKAEHAVDLKSGALRAITVHPADTGDTWSIYETLAATDDMAVLAGAREIEEVVSDKGYHSDDVMVQLDDLEVRSYIAEPNRGRRRWKGRKKVQGRVYANRRRQRGVRGQLLQRKRAELSERSNAHMYETGAMRRLHVRGRENVEKRLLIHGAAFNIGLMLRKRFGIGTPRSLQGRQSGLSALLSASTRALTELTGWLGVTDTRSSTIRVSSLLSVPHFAPTA